MVWNYAYGFTAPIVLALLIGFPIAAWSGVGHGVRAIGYACALGTALLLILCRGAQMISPLGSVKCLVLGAIVLAIAFAWSRRPTRAACVQLFSNERRGVLVLFGTVIIISVLLGAPILFGNAIQFEGTRNADSFTFTQSAQYMVAHAFYGAPDFSPEHPVYTISRAYFGHDAMQPRPAAEGLLAWLSAMRAVDPMYLYNAVQAAGVMLAGLTALAFLPLGWHARRMYDWALIAVYALLCPTLLHVAANSNFANAFNLPAATAYVAIGLSPRTRGTFFISVLFIGSMISGYPELLVFVAMTRGLSVALDGLSRRAIANIGREAAWMTAELIVACIVLPWAALGALSVFKTTLDVSHAGASDLGGNMFAGLPLFTMAAIALALAWRALGAMPDAGRRSYLAAILLAFALAQGAMLARGFGYGGFKISEYFSMILIGVAFRSVLSAPAGVRVGRIASVFAAAVAVMMVVKSSDVLRRSWDWSHSRRVTPDLVQAGHELARLSHGLPVALGASPEPFYYGMWVPYVSTVPIAFDLDRDADAAGYLSPYLRLSGREGALWKSARLRLEISGDVQNVEGESIARYGNVLIRTKS
jgi:hypothetical protein